jgi:hypothetical protein
MEQFDFFNPDPGSQVKEHLLTVFPHLLFYPQSSYYEVSLLFLVDLFWVRGLKVAGSNVSARGTRSRALYVQKNKVFDWKG